MVATSDLGSDAERRGGSSPFIRTSDCLLAVAFFVRIKELAPPVAPRQSYLRSVVVCYANTRVCCLIVSENKFSPHHPPTPTIFDCNNLSLLCSRLQRTFEGGEYQSLLGFRLCFLLFFVCVVATRCAFYILFSIFAVRWSVVCGSIVRALFRHGVKRIYVT